MEPRQTAYIARMLDTAIEAAQKWEAPLGDDQPGPAVAAFEALKQSQLQLGHPQGYTQRLQLADFVTQGVDLAPDVRHSLEQEQYALYSIAVPVLLFPRRGAHYCLLECQLTFADAQGQHQVGIQRIFPDRSWQAVFEWGGELTLALDGQLNWGAEVQAVDVAVDQLSGHLSGRVAQENMLRSFFKLRPFCYTGGRMEVEAQFSDDTAIWRLDSQEIFTCNNQVQFVTLLQVPQTVTTLHITALAQAEVAFDWLFAQVRHVFEYLPEVIQALFRQRKGLPLQDYQEWNLTLPV